MSVSTHLGIDLAEYDHRIRTFIPHYEEMLAAAVVPLRALAGASPTIVELGVGTGGLAQRCLAALPRARFVGLDADPAILAVARERLAVDGRREPRIELAAGDFERASLPRCDAIVASLALHHVRTRRAKHTLYARCHAALRRGGLFVNADVHLAADPALASLEHAAWHAHLASTYGARGATRLLRAWAHEDVYRSLEDEHAMLADAGFAVDVVWRRGPFAVLAARRRQEKRQ
jgi:tRNA (cmo5U34)-methyltransferase